jgi:MFS family permease
MQTNTFNKNLVIVGISESVSGLGNWITMMAIFALLIFKGDGTIITSSGVFLAGLFPAFLFSPVAGFLCDRYDRKKLMIISEVLSGIVILGLVFTENIIIIYGLIAIQAITISIMSPARQSSVPALVPADQLTQANAFLQQLAGILKIFAPVLAGFLLSVVSPHTAIIFDVISFFLSALILTRLPALPPEKDNRESIISKPTKNQQNWYQRIIFIFKSSTGLKLLFTVTFFAIFVVIGFDVLSPIFIRDVLQGNEKIFGFSVGMIGLGTLAASIILMVNKKRKKYWDDLILGIGLLAIIPVGLVLVTIVNDLRYATWLLLGACFIGGVGNGFLVIQATTLLQILSPRENLGKLSGLFQSTAIFGQLCGLILIPLIVPNLLLMPDFFWVMTFLLIMLFVIMVFYTKIKRTQLAIPIPSENILEK